MLLRESGAKGKLQLRGNHPNRTVKNSGKRNRNGHLLNEDQLLRISSVALVPGSDRGNFRAEQDSFQGAGASTRGSGRDGVKAPS